jgi:nicotinamide phosphoribosyltransferase
MSVLSYIEPKVLDKAFSRKLRSAISLILRADSYKFAHAFAYRDGIEAMASYGTARVNEAMTIVTAGGQYLVMKYFTQQITMDDVNEAEAYALAHFGRKLFSRDDWEAVVHDHNGFIPITLRALPDGTIGHGQLCQYSVIASGRFFWMSSYFETVIQRGFWYPSTVATQDYLVAQDIKRFYEESGADLGLLRFALHDFGGRGVTVGEQAEVGGMAHLYNFMGSDTIEGVVRFNDTFKAEMGAFSVYATEHSVECSFGLDNPGERAYLLKQISNAVPGGIVSIVIDGRDWHRCADNLCNDPEIKAAILASGAKIVFRPDSGDMLEIAPIIIKMQQQAYGHDEVIGRAGRIYRRTKTVGMIWGDGIDHNAIRTMLGNLVA